MSLATTLGNEAWMLANEGTLRGVLPADWTEPSMSELIRMGFQFKLLGIDWRSNDELVKILAFLQRVRIAETHGTKYRRHVPARTGG